MVSLLKTASCQWLVSFSGLWMRLAMWTCKLPILSCETTKYGSRLYNNTVCIASFGPRNETNLCSKCGNLCAKLCVTCKVQGMLTIWKSLVEKLSSFVKLVSLFRKPINQYFWWGLLFLSLILHSWIVTWLHGCDSNARNVSKYVFWKMKLTNGTEKAPQQWTFRKLLKSDNSLHM